jgi:NADH pyrophosphatase NudC (nudix superfamily)
MRPSSLVRQPTARTIPTRPTIGIRGSSPRRSDAASKASSAATKPPTLTKPPPPPQQPPRRRPPQPPPFFSDLGLDRCSAARKDAALLKELSQRAGAEAIVVRGGDALTFRRLGNESESETQGSEPENKDPDAPAAPDLFLARLPLAEAAEILAASGSRDSPILLGVEKKEEEEEEEIYPSSSSPPSAASSLSNAGAPLFAVALPRGPEGDAAAARAVEEATKRAAAGEAAAAGPSLPSFAFAFAPVRSEGPRMPPGDAAAAALAVGLSSFHAQARFDPRSGAVTEMASAGHARDAVEEKREEEKEEGRAEGGREGEMKDEEKKKKRRAKRPNRSRPRIDPAVLVLASCRDFVLLGRKASWPKRRYSLLAGFAELGETLEQAAERELFEEAGVVASRLQEESSSPSRSRYLGSQPWPFPSSLMVAMRVDVDPIGLEEEGGKQKEEASSAASGRGGGGGGARARAPPALTQLEVSEATRPLRSLPRALPLDGELEDVRWFPLEVVREACEEPAAASGLRLPGRHALARTVLSSWSEEAASSCSPSSSLSLFSGAFPRVPVRSLPESSSTGEEEEEARRLYELFRVRRRKKKEEEKDRKGEEEEEEEEEEETALALRWSSSSSPSSSPSESGGDRELLLKAFQEEAASFGFAVEALGGGEIAFGRRRTRKREGKDEDEDGEDESSVPAEERRIVLRKCSSSPSSSSPAPHELVASCLLRRGHPLVEVVVE